MGKIRHLHVWGIPNAETKLRFGSAWVYYEQCTVCGIVRLMNI